MKALKDYLGLWQYKGKLYAVIPAQENLSSYKVYYCQLRWVAHTAVLWDVARPEFLLATIESREALRRLRDKERGGYRLIGKYEGFINASAELESASLIKPAKQGRKRKRWLSRCTSFGDWLDGKDFKRI